MTRKESAKLRKLVVERGGTVQDDVKQAKVAKAKKIKIGQRFKSKDSGKIIEIIKKASGNRHWIAKQINGNYSHKIHEGTLAKYYDLQRKKPEPTGMAGLKIGRNTLIIDNKNVKPGGKL